MRLDWNVVVLLSGSDGCGVDPQPNQILMKSRRMLLMKRKTERAESPRRGDADLIQESQSETEKRTRRSREEEQREKKRMFNVYTATARPLGG